MYNEYSKRKHREEKHRYRAWQKKALKRKQLRSIRGVPFSDGTYAEQQKNETLKILREKP